MKPEGSQGSNEVSERVKAVSKLPGLETEGLRVGLRPERGWARRNYQFWRRSLLPTLLRSRRARSSDGSPAFPGLAEREIEVTWIGHASFLVRTPWMNILIDPNWALWHGFVKRASHPGCRLEHLPKIDLILITHAHFDHLHLPTLRRVAASHQTVLVPRGVGRLLRRMNVRQVREMNTWETYLGGEVEIIFAPSYHWGARYLHDTHRGFGGFVIRTPHSTLYHCGDSAYFDGFAELGSRYDIDLALLPIGAYDAPSGRDVHMNPEEALQAFEDLRAQRMIPMHYGAFPLGGESMEEPIERLASAVADRGLEHCVVAPREGESLLLWQCPTNGIQH